MLAGRFLQPDPKHFAAGDYNLYRYCHNDPVNHTDPDGLAMFGLYESYGDYFADVGQTFIGEAKGAGNILSLGLYQPSYANINQQYGGYVGQALTVIGVAAATRAGPAKPAETTAIRTTRSGEKAVEITKADGSRKDISASRVKEWVPNTNPKAPPGAQQKVKFENAQPGSKGYKRDPTAAELKKLRDLTGK